MCDNVNHNPFAGLFSTINEAASFSSQSHAAVEEDPLTESADRSLKAGENSVNIKANDVPKEDILVNNIVEEVFGLTLSGNKDRIESGRQLVFLEELAYALAPQDWLNAESVEHAIFERLMLADPESKVIGKKNGKEDCIDGHILQTEIVPYLFESYCRLLQYKSNEQLRETIDNMKQIVVRNIGTALQEPDLFQSQEVRF